MATDRLMRTVLWLLSIQGAIGAFDTFYFHEWRAKLPAHAPHTSPELKLHALRDFLYAVLFCSLPWIAWQGWWVALLGAVLSAEIVLTLTDFVVEIAVRKPLGDVYGGERITHAVMGILYGAMLAHLIPVLAEWRRQPTALAFVPLEAPWLLRWLVTGMGLGVLLSGLRDLYAALCLPHGGWPWTPSLLPRANRP